MTIINRKVNAKPVSEAPKKKVQVLRKEKDFVLLSFEPHEAKWWKLKGKGK